MEQQYEYEYEEGQQCPECKEGRLEFQEVEGCSCHINPPCPAHENLKLECRNCYWEED